MPLKCFVDVRVTLKMLGSLCLFDFQDTSLTVSTVIYKRLAFIYLYYRENQFDQILLI